MEFLGAVGGRAWPCSSISPFPCGWRRDAYCSSERLFIAKKPDIQNREKYVMQPKGFSLFFMENFTGPLMGKREKGYSLWSKCV